MNQLMLGKNDLSVIKHSSYEQAERMYLRGYLSEFAWTVFGYIWVNSVYRYSNLCASLVDEDVRFAHIAGGFERALPVAIEKAKNLLSAQQGEK